MHGHGVLMLAAVGVIAAFVPIVMVVTMLQRRGRLGDPTRRVPFSSYGPVLAGTFTAGAAAVHLGLIAEHATLSATSGTAAVGVAALGGAAAFICSVGAGTTHFASADASIGGFLPVGVASLVLAPVHAAWSVPRLWRRFPGALIGLAITLAVVAIGVAPALIGLQGGTTVGYADVLGIILEVSLIAVFGLLVVRRPERLLRRLEISITDAWVGTGLGIAAVAIFSAVAIVGGHGVH